MNKIMTALMMALLLTPVHAGHEDGAEDGIQAQQEQEESNQWQRKADEYAGYINKLKDARIEVTVQEIEFGIKELEFLYNAGNWSLYKKKLDQIINQFSSADLVNSSAPAKAAVLHALSLKAMSCLVDGQPDQAVATLETLASTYNKELTDPEANLNMLMGYMLVSYYYKDALDEARMNEYADKGLEIGKRLLASETSDRHKVLAASSMMNLYQNKNMLEEAVRFYQDFEEAHLKLTSELRNIDPILASLATLYHARGDIPRAEEYSRMLEHNTASEHRLLTSLINRFFIAVETDRADQALALARRYIAIVEDNEWQGSIMHRPMLMLKQAYQLERAGHLKEAIALYDRFLAKETGLCMLNVNWATPYIYWRKCEIYKQLGDTAQYNAARRMMNERYSKSTRPHVARMIARMES